MVLSTVDFYCFYSNTYLRHGGEGGEGGGYGFIPRPTKLVPWELASPRMSVRPPAYPHFVSDADLGKPWMDLLNFANTHPLGDVDVTFGSFQI